MAIDPRYVYVFVHSSVFVHLGMELGHVSNAQFMCWPVMVDDFAEKFWVLKPNAAARALQRASSSASFWNVKQTKVAAIPQLLGYMQEGEWV